MKLANLGAGGTRPQDEHWFNVDTLHELFPHGTPERSQLDKEQGYINHDLRDGVPFPDNDLDGVMCAHVLEHLTLHDCVKLLRECRRALKLGGVLMVSVPDAKVFAEHYWEDTVENAERIFGEPIHLPDGETTFMGYAGFTHNHLQLFSKDSMWCCMARAGFCNSNSLNVVSDGDVMSLDYPIALRGKTGPGTPFWNLFSILNRLPFSLVMVGVKE